MQVLAADPFAGIVAAGEAVAAGFVARNVAVKAQMAPNSKAKTPSAPKTEASFGTMNAAGARKTPMRCVGEMQT